MSPTTPHDRLVHLYQDVTRLTEISSPSFILHRAFPRNAPPLHGIAAAQAHEEAFVRATNGTLVMKVDKITISTDGVFGCVFGVIEAGYGGREEQGETTTGKEGIRMPFCGLWKFDEDGMAVEHWENAAEPEKFGRWLVEFGRE